MPARQAGEPAALTISSCSTSAKNSSLGTQGRRGDGRRMRTLKHLPLAQWPEVDREAFRRAYEPGDLFDETAGPGAHLAEGTRRIIRTKYRRWLGFLTANYPDD